MSETPMNEMSGAAEAPPLHFTDAAAHKVGQLIEQEGNAALKLRSGARRQVLGFQYGFTFDKEPGRRYGDRERGVRSSSTR
jgi:iron-sulfur cluster insertion protein